MKDDRGIVERLVDFDRYGNTATERFSMRYQAAQEINRLRAEQRGAFRAGWYVNATPAGDGEDQQPADYLAGCEEVDWCDFKKRGN